MGSHAVGADLTYTHISGNDYQVRLSFYRDCYGISAPQSPSITYTSNNCGQSSTVILSLLSSIEVSMLCPSVLPNSTCNPAGTILGIEEYIYEGTVTLPANCSDWVLSYSVCCRNAAITNSPNAQSYDLYLETELDNLNTPGNSSPYFTTLPIFYACSGQPVIYTPGAVDIDGDSLSYSLVAPKDNSSTNVPYVIPFSAAYPLSTSPPNNFTLDPISGQMNFTPNGPQVGIVTVLVEEFRNGTKIGSVPRDMQLVVVTNCTNNSPKITPPTSSTINGGTISGNVISTCAGTNLSFPILASDSNPADTLLVSSNISTLPGATLTVLGTNPLILNFDWPTTGANVGDHPLIVVVSDNGCPIKYDQSYSVIISVLSYSVAPTDLVMSNPAACAGDTVSLMALGGAGVNLVYYEGSCGGTMIPDPNTVVISGATNYFARYEDSCGVTACATAGTNCFNFKIEVSALLEGPTSSTSALMSDALRVSNLLPFSEPYAAMGYQHIGGGNESTVAAVYSVTGSNAIVDWVFVELRSASDYTTAVATRSVLLQADGDIVDMDGSSGVDFAGLVPAGNYWIVIRHRTHIDVMSTTFVSLGGTTAATYDFNTSGAFGNGLNTLTNGLKVLYSGDVNFDNKVNSSDRSMIWNARNQTGYLIEDTTLNGYCGADDRSEAWNNRNIISQIP